MKGKFRFLLSILVLLLVELLSSNKIYAAEKGEVLSEQKISDLVGGLTENLEANDNFGYAVSNIGDLDGDGNEDIVVGAHQDDDEFANAGAVYILFLNSNGTVKAEQKISNLAGGLTADLDANDYFGAAVSGLGDLDGDGNPDIAVGAYGDDDGTFDRGAVYILFLNSNGTVKAEQKISDTQGGFVTALDSFDYFGSSVSNIGDLDGDGNEDIVVGARKDADGGVDTGAVYILFLNSDGTVKAEQKISDLAGGLTEDLEVFDYFGSSVSNIGDLDGDGNEDIVVGAFGDDDGASLTGAVYILFLNSDGTVKAEQKISNLAGGLTADLDANDYFGTAVSGLGDLDGDGNPDIVVGAQYDDNLINEGAVYILFLNSNGTVASEQKIGDGIGGKSDLPNNSNFGSSVSDIGDLDGDGYTDIVVGARNDSDEDSGAGAVYILNLQGVDTISPILFSVFVDDLASTSATINWTSDEASLSKVNYGFSSSYTASTLETNTEVTNHSVLISGLAACSTYHYQASSKDAAGNEGVSADQTFTTTGCTGSATVNAQTSSSVTTASGGLVSLVDGGTGINLVIPANFSGVDAEFQIKQLDKESVISSISTPPSYSLVGSYLYDMKALSDTSTIISSFDNSLTVTMTYDTSDLSGFDENSLTIYRWDGSLWSELANCSTDTSTKTVTCTTDAFSIFGLLAQASATSTASSNNSSQSSQPTASSTTCGDLGPSSIPDLFQIDVTDTSAKIFFTPISNTNEFYISFSNDPTAEEHGAQVNLAKEGVQNFTIDLLKPNSTYYFKVRGQKGCAPGEWSNAVRIRTQGKNTSGSISFYRVGSVEVEFSSSYEVGSIKKDSLSLSTNVESAVNSDQPLEDANHANSSPAELLPDREVLSEPVSKSNLWQNVANFFRSLFGKK